MELKNSYKIAFTYVGAIVGAGFATGQEIYQFFTVFKLGGLIGSIVSTLGFIIFGWIYLSIVFKEEIHSYNDLLKLVLGDKIARIFDICISFFLFSSYTIMIAAAYSLVNTYLINSPILSYLIVITIVWLSFAKGVKGIININTYLIPVLVVIIVILCICNIQKSIPVASVGIVPNNYLFSSITYVSYNLIIGMVVLSSLKEEIYNKKVIFFAPIISGLVMGIMLLLITSALLTLNSPSEIPILDLADNLNHGFLGIFIFGIGIAILTSALASGYGLINRIKQKISIKYNVLVCLITFIAIPLSLLGFSSLIGFVYPFFGFVNLVVMLLSVKFVLVNKTSLIKGKKIF